MGFSFGDFWEGADWWDKEENARQQKARTVRATQNKPAPAKTKKAPPILRNNQPYENTNKSDEIKRVQNKSNLNDFEAGRIDRQRYQENLRNILEIRDFKLGNVDQFVKNQADLVSRNPVARPVLTGLASWSPTNLGGNLVGYAGRAGEAIGIEGSEYLTEAGDNVASLHRGEGEFANRGLTDSLISGGIELAGDLASFGAGGLAKGGVMGLKNAGKIGTGIAKAARFSPTARFFTQSANSLAGEMKDAGYSPTTALAAGTGLGAVVGGMERIGLGGIAGKTANRGLKGATTRLVTSSLTEGTTEGAQEIAENTARRLTVNPEQNIFENVAESALVGGILGGVAGGGVDLATNQNTQQAVKKGATAVNNEINHGVVKDNLIKKTARRKTINEQKNEANKNGNKKVYNRLSKIEADLDREIKGLERREKILRNRIGNSLELTNDEELNARNNTESDQSLDQDNKTTSSTDSLADLKAEARKPITVYRGGNATDISKAGDRGISVTTDKDVASRFAERKSANVGEQGQVDQLTVDPNAKTLDATTVTQQEVEKVTGMPILGETSIVEYAKKQGYDVVDFTNKTTGFEQESELRVLNPKVLNQAQQETKAPVESKVKKPKNQTKAITQSEALQPAGQQRLANQKTPKSQKGLKVTGEQSQLSKSKPLVNTPIIPSFKDKGNAALVHDTEFSEFTNQDASRPLDSFDAVAANPKSKNARKLVTEIAADKNITEVARQAQLDGKEVNFYAKKDENGRSVGIEQFDPKRHRIESGFVLDENQNILGNHIKVDETGMQINVGGEVVNVDTIIGNPLDWQGNYKMMETMDRNMKNNAPDDATYRRSRRFLIDHKIKNEAIFRKELHDQRKSLNDRTKAVEDARPKNVSKKEYQEDIFDYIEGNLKPSELKSKYVASTVREINQYKKDTRKLYDGLLERVNETYTKFGEQLVPKRKDYLTHINELMEKPSFAGEMYGRLQNSIVGEGTQTTRGSVPAEIAGRTENFAPRKKWNRFFQQRKGGEFTKDPFKAVDAYLEPTLYNIHMTESAVRARAIEAAFRTASKVQEMDKAGLKKELAEAMEEPGKAKDDKLTAGFAEFANALAGKTQRWDRQAVDASKASELGLRGWQRLQATAGRATILGNMSSVISQGLNQPVTLASAGVQNYIKGIGSFVNGSTPSDKSSFLNARKTSVDSNFRSRGKKILDAGGVPLQATEMFFVEMTWNAEYHKALEDGFKGQEAILEADRRTEQDVAGRGIADKPEVYRSTLSNGFLQYTLEVSAANKKIMQDLSPTQKGKFMVAAFAANSLVGLITGFEPLPDFIGATLDTIGDYVDDDDERSAAEKAVGGVQRYAGEVASLNPLTTAVANTVLPKSYRQALFGDESDLGRFEGTAAPIQVVLNALGSGKSLAEGNLKDARNKALKILPYGNQAKKTTTGAETIIDGHAVDSQGNPTFAAPTSIAGKAQALTFGANATKEAQNYYEGEQGNITGKDDLARLESSSDKRAEVESIQTRRQDKKRQEGTIPITDKTEKSGTDFISRDKYDAILHAFTKNDNSSSNANITEGKLGNIGDYDDAELKKAVSDVNTELNNKLKELGLPAVKSDSRVARDYASHMKSDSDTSLDTFLRKAYKTKPPTDYVQAELKAWLGGTVDIPEPSEDVINDWVNYRINDKNGEHSLLDKDSKRKTILRSAFNAQLENVERDLHSLSEVRLFDALDNNLITEENINNALAVERQLYDAGLISKETLARKVAGNGRGYKTSKSGGRGGSKKKSSVDYSIFGGAGGANPTSITKSLRAILESASI